MEHSIVIAIVGLIAQIGTFLLALLIYLEAQKIKKVEWQKSFEEIFSNPNKTMFSLCYDGERSNYEYYKEWRKIKNVDLMLDHPARFIFHEKINAYNSLFYGYTNGFLSRDLALQAFNSFIIEYSDSMEEFIDILKRTGYNSDFILFLNERFQATSSISKHA